MTTDTDETFSASLDAAAVRKPNLFRRTALSQFPDIPLLGCNLYKLYKMFGSAEGMTFTSDAGNSIVLTGAFKIESLRRTNIFLKGRNNHIVLDGLRNVHQLNVACVSGSRVSIKTPHTMRGLTILCSHGSHVDIGHGCMISRDVLIYSSKAHGLYSVSDGSRRYKQGIEIAAHVWLGQGARLLAGAKIGQGSVIGSYSVLAGTISNNCAAAGNPCRVTTKDIFWSNDSTVDEGNYYSILEKYGKPMPSFVNLTKDDG